MLVVYIFCLSLRRRPWPGRTKKTKSNLPAEAGKFDFLQYACRGGVGWGGVGKVDYI